MAEDPIIAAQRAAYQRQFLEHGDTPEGTYQNNRVTQNLRFARILKEIAPHFEEGDTIHDIGSGLCDFYAYMKTLGLDKTLTYSGTEIVQEMNDRAKKKYPELQLINRDILKADPSDRYDFVVLSGTFNLLGGVDEEEWRAMCMAMVEKMYGLANKAVAFNMLTSYRTFSDPTLCYFDPAQVLDFAERRLSRFVCMDHCYPLFEFTCTVLKPDYLAAHYDHADLKKYFGGAPK